MDASRAAWQVAKLHRPRLLRLVDPFTSQIKLRLPPPASPFPPEFHSQIRDRRTIGTDSVKSTLSASWNYATVRGLYLRQISQLVSPSKGSMKVMFIDTLALVRRLESQGLTPKQAEAVTAAIIEVLNDSMDNVAQTFVSKPDMQKNEMTQEAALAKVKTEMQHGQEYKVSLLQREVERIRTDVDKMRSDLRYEIDKVTAGQRLDINLERGRTREDLSKQSAETSELTNKLDREINSLKTQLETAKYEVIKYGVGTIVSLTAVGLGLLRILM